MKNKHISIKTQITVSVSILIAVVVLLVGAIAISYFYHELETAIVQQQKAIVGSVAKDIDDKFFMAQKALVACAAVVPPHIIGDPEKANLFLQNRPGTRSIFERGLVMLNRNGTLIACTLDSPAREELERELHDQCMESMKSGRVLISDSQSGRLPHEKLLILFTAPIIDAGGGRIGILGGVLDLLTDNILLGGASGTRYGDAGIAIFNAKRTMIVPSDRKNLSKRGFDDFGEHEDKKEPGNEMKTVNESGEYASFKKLASIDWIIAGNYPVAETYSALKRVIIVVITLSLFVCGLSVFLVRLLIGKYSYPLMRFIKHVEYMPSYEGKERFFACNSSGEINVLGNAFNAMLNKQDEQQEDLQKAMNLYRLIADLSTDMVLWIGPDHTMLYVSPQCRKLTGYSEEEFYDDRNLIDWIIHPDDLQRWQEHKGETCAELQPEALEFRIVTKSGEIRRVNHYCHKVHDSAGDFLGIHGSFHDITSFRENADKLKVEKRLAEKIIDLAGVPLYAVDSARKVIFWNKECADLTGICREEAVGNCRRWTGENSESPVAPADLIIDGTPGDAAGYFPQCTIIETNGGLQVAGWFFINGRKRFLAVTATPIRNGGGKLVAVVETLHELQNAQIEGADSAEASGEQ